MPLLDPLAWNPPPPPTGSESLVDVFLRLACLIYGDWHRSNPAKARRLLADHPDLAAASIYAHSELPRLDEMIETLIGHGVDLNVRTTAGETLLDRAIARGVTGFADALRAHGACTSTGVTF